MNNKLTVLDLFSGIGGFSLGLESTGYFETVAFCEKDEFCKKVLQKHWSQLKIYDDVRSLHDTKIQADVVTGGFPCQSFSQAGLQKGRTDDRWLWNEMFDVIKQVRPRWVIGENVQGIINIEQGMALRQVRDDLESEGFQVQCFIIPASGIGAWHNRNRVWILANSEHNGPHRQKRNETIKSSDKQKDRVSIGDDKDVSDTNSIRHRRGNSTRCSDEEWTFLPREQEGGEMGSEIKRCSNVPNTKIKRPQGHRLSTNMEEKQRRKDFSAETSIKEQQTWWQIESRICGVPDGLSYGVDRDRAKRIKALGNSIVPQIVRQLGLAIIKAEET
jgi:DNA (cytosine-5)-methyltransferase 1